MRHVSRTHRVAWDWLFDRINLDSEIQIRYTDTKHQLADILTKGSFTRDEWNNLLHLVVNRVTIIDTSLWYKIGNTVVTILPVQKKNLSGDPEEPDEVPGADREARSHLH